MDKQKSSSILASRVPALTSRNFRLFWGGQLISLIGTWMQNIGQAWLVLQLTDSAFKLGLVNALQFLPMTMFSLVAGTFVDRFPKRKILLFTQTSFMVLAFILATLTHLEKIQYWHILILASGLGLVNSFDIPTRQSYVIELVGKEKIMNAIALNSAIFNLGRILGPAVAGIMIGLLGMATCFYINAFSFLAVIYGIWLIDAEPLIRKVEGVHVFREIREGVAYVRHLPVLILPLSLMAVFSTFIMNYNVLIPVFAKQNMDQSAMGFGLLMTAVGVGSMFSALLSAVSGSKWPIIRTLLGGALGASFFMVVWSFQTDFILVCLILFAVGFFTISFTMSANTTLQLYTDDRMRGRVMSMFAFVWSGLMPLGSIFAGQVAEIAGAKLCILLSGLIGLVASSAAVMIIRKKPEIFPFPSSNVKVKDE